MAQAQMSSITFVQGHHDTQWNDQLLALLFFIPLVWLAKYPLRGLESSAGRVTTHDAGFLDNPAHTCRFSFFHVTDRLMGLGHPAFVGTWSTTASGDKGSGRRWLWTQVIPLASPSPVGVWDTFTWLMLNLLVPALWISNLNLPHKSECHHYHHHYQNLVSFIHKVWVRDY